MYLRTSNIRARFSFKAGYPLDDMRRSTRPSNIEEQLVLHMNRLPWYLSDISAVV